MTTPRIADDRRLRIARLSLGSIGVALIALGGLLFVEEIPAARYPGVAAWLLGAIVLHDGVIAGVVLLAGILLRLTPWHPVTKAVFAGAAVVGGIVALLVVPAAVKASIGTANPTILPFDYLGNLLWFELGIVVVAGAAVGVARLVRGRRAVSARSAQ